jgi:hypothetical protein
MIQCRLLTPDEFSKTEDARRAAVAARRAELGIEGWSDDLTRLSESFLPPGSMWFCPWYHDPSKPEDLARIEPTIAKLKADPNASFHLSIHYWTDWARIRPPITVVCPGGGQWVIDSKSTNGSGWTVTGTAPNLVANPSIWVGQGTGPPREYHGWLGQSGAAPGFFSNPV